MKRLFIPLFKIVLSIFFLWFLVKTSKLNFALLLNFFNSPGWLAAVFILFIITPIISAMRWHLLNKAQGISLTFFKTIIPTYFGISFNNLLPGNIGGDFVRFYFLSKRIAVAKSKALTSILFDRISGLLGIFVLVSFVIIFQLNKFNEKNILFYFMLTSLTISLVSIIVFFFSMLLPQKIGLSDWVNQKFDLPKLKITRPLFSFLHSIRIYRNSKKTMLQVLGISVIIQLLIALTCMVIAEILHFPPLPFHHYILAAAITQIINLIPVAPGGFGIGEMAFANTLFALNPHLNLSYATIFLGYRLIGLVTYLPSIAFFIFDFKKIRYYNLANVENQEVQTLNS